MTNPPTLGQIWESETIMKKKQPKPVKRAKRTPPADERLEERPGPKPFLYGIKSHLRRLERPK
jgi:hypothetical protein